MNAPVPVWHCPVCDERFLSREAIDAHRKEMNHGPNQTPVPHGPSLLETARRIVAFADEAGMADECWLWNLAVLRRLVAAPHLSQAPEIRYQLRDAHHVTCLVAGGACTCLEWREKTIAALAGGGE